MAKAPNKCPNCGSLKFFKVAKGKGGFSTGKAVAGAVAFGPLGLVAGGLGKKRVAKLCDKCGFYHEY